jgi:hypothetical protein
MRKNTKRRSGRKARKTAKRVYGGDAGEGDPRLRFVTTQNNITELVQEGVSDILNILEDHVKIIKPEMSKNSDAIVELANAKMMRLYSYINKEVMGKKIFTLKTLDNFLTNIQVTNDSIPLLPKDPPLENSALVEFAEYYYKRALMRMEPIAALILQLYEYDYILSTLE